MAFLRTTRAPSSAPGGLVWKTVEDVIEVEDALANDLLHIPDGGFHEVEPKSKPKASTKTPITEPDPDATPKK